LEPGIGYKANVVIFWFFAIPGFMMVCALLLSRCKRLGSLHRVYCDAPVNIQRNITVYIMHIVLDTVVICLWVDSLIATWCGCSEAIAGGRTVGFVSLFVVVAYAVELVWRIRLNTLLLVHHVVTILVISVLVGELAAFLYLAADAMLLLVVSALIEQPTFVALLLLRTLPEGSKHTLRAWRVAVWFWVISKTLSVVLAGALMARDWGFMAGWMRGLYVTIWALIYGIQMWSAYVQYGIYTTVAQKAVLLQQLAPFDTYVEQDAPLVGKDVDAVMHVPSAVSRKGSSVNLKIRKDDKSV
jgi:hypothetical protein